MNCLKSLFIFFPVLMAPLGHALSVETLARIEKNQNLNPFASTIYGGTHAYFEGGLSGRKIWNIEGDDFQKQNFKVAVWMPNALLEQKQIARPLAIIFPGTYNDHESGQANGLSKILLKKGYHMLTLPNPVSLSYVQAGVKSSTLDLETEAAVLYRTIKKILQKIGPKNISSVHFVGISYGAFLAAVIAANDSINAEPILSADSTITMLSPPLQFHKALQRLDKDLEETQELWDREFPSGKPLAEVYQLFRAPRSADLPARVVEISRAYCSHLGFKKPAGESLQTHNDIWGLSLIGKSGKERKEWARSLRLLPALSVFSPKGYKFLTESPGANLGFWLAKVKEQMPELPLRIIAAKDDPLNEAADWYSNSFFNLPEYASLLNSGGHYGFSTDPDFRKGLVEYFTAPSFYITND